jgi:YggT family protein
MAELVYTRRTSLGVIAERVINVIIGLIELLLAVRLVLELFAANAGSPFVAWVYSASSNFTGAFAGAFPALQLGNGSVIDFSTILAMIVYAVIGWLLVELVLFVFRSVG